MALVEDETFCGVYCPHPPCWAAQRRIIRGVPNLQQLHPNSGSEEEDDDNDNNLSLPTQKIVNLLEGDIYLPYSAPSSLSISKSASALLSIRSPHKNRVPHASPISVRRSGVPPKRGSASARDVPADWTPQVRHVEVQEVFDLADLQSDWNDTFLAKKCYVWVPSTNPQPDAARKENAAGEKETKQPLLKDMTEDMVPREVQLERENQKLRQHGPPGRRSPCMFFNSPPRPHFSRQGYHGLHELLDLPRDVLAALMEHIPERDMLDQERFAIALLKTLPKLQQKNKSVSLAYGNIIYQSKKPILDGSSKHVKLETESVSSKQVFKLKDDMWEHFSYVNDPDAQRAPMQISHDKSTSRFSSPRFTDRQPLPSISPGKRKTGDSDQGQGKRMPRSVTLEASGEEHTRPFHYKNISLDLSLGPKTVNVKSVRKDDTPIPRSTERSAIHVTMPAVSTESTDINISPDKKIDRILQGPEEKEGLKENDTRNKNISAKVSQPHQSNSMQNRENLSKIAAPSEKSSRKQGVSRPQGRSVRFTGAPGSAESRRSPAPSKISATVGSVVCSDIASDGALTYRQQNSEPITPTATPEPWPHVDEDALAGTVTPSLEAPQPVKQVSPAPDRQPGHYRHLWSEDQSDINSPAPPPPSPEPRESPRESMPSQKENSTQVESPTQMETSKEMEASTQDEDSLDARKPPAENTPIARPLPPGYPPGQGTLYPPAMVAQDSTLSLLSLPQYSTDSESQYTISALPPSNLDDISRINTPASYASRPFISREPTQGDLPTVTEVSDTPRTEHDPSTARSNQDEANASNNLQSNEAENEAISNEDSMAQSNKLIKNNEDQSMPSNSEATKNDTDIAKTQNKNTFDANQEALCSVDQNAAKLDEKTKEKEEKNNLDVPQIQNELEDDLQKLNNDLEQFDSNNKQFTDDLQKEMEKLNQ